MESLQGSFLISTSKMPDPRFREKLIYMCGHTEEGAIGFVDADRDEYDPSSRRLFFVLAMNIQKIPDKL